LGIPPYAFQRQIDYSILFFYMSTEIML